MVETGTIKGECAVGKVYGTLYKGSASAYSSTTSTVSGNRTIYYSDGTSYKLELPNTVTYTSGSDTIEVDSLSYYDSVGMLDTVIGGDNDSSGYYLDYDSTGDKIIVVPVGGIPAEPGDEDPVVPPGDDDVNEEYSASGIVGTTDTTPPVCTFNYVVPVSNGIRGSFSCTDESGAPTVRSLFDSTTSLAAKEFDKIGTLKSGRVSGNTKTVISTWTVNNEISQPAKGLCYYYRLGGKDTEGNWSTYVTSKCYHAFSE